MSLWHHFLDFSAILGENANVNRMVIVEAQRVSEHQLSEWCSPIVNRTAIVEAQRVTVSVSESNQLSEWGLPPKWRHMRRNTMSLLVPDWRLKHSDHKVLTILELECSRATGSSPESMLLFVCLLSLLLHTKFPGSLSPWKLICQ